MKLFFLSKENIDLARGEAEALFGKGKLIESIFLIDEKNKKDARKKSGRLAYTKRIIDVLIEADEKNIEQKIKKYNWDKKINSSFALFFIENGEVSQSLSRKYGGMIYDSLKAPKVNLENPETKLIMLEIGKKFCIGTEEWENKQEFFKRRPNTRPGQQPVTIMPKLARACVNLSKAEKEVYDPFCGTGGFLIEAGLMNLRAIGSDISLKMTKLCKENLLHYKIKHFRVFQQDALKIDKKYDYVVTDPPYGKASKVVGCDLYYRFLLKLKKILRKRAVVIFPNFISAEKLIKNSNLKIKGHYSVYVHKNLTREIYVLES